MAAEPSETRALVREVMSHLAVHDIHTHLFDPGMGDLLLSGIDELLVYHYHVAELFRVRPDLPPERFFAMPRTEQADLVWRELFVARSPLSEVGVGVTTLLAELGLDPAAQDLREARTWFAARDVRQRVDEVFDLARVERVCMTNDPLDPHERQVWERGFARDRRFDAALRLDSAIVGWPQACASLRALGHAVDERLEPSCRREVARYLEEWIERMQARYMAVSLPPSFRYPDDLDPTAILLGEVVTKVAAERGLPVALMIGVRRGVNPRLGLAGDGSGGADVGSVERLARDHPDVRFLVTLLSREDQHSLCVTARKFANVVPFGCWWFVNQPRLIEEITAMRLDLLGPTFVPQHSDARVLEQLVFKWARSRRVLGEVLADRYAELAIAGRPIDAEIVERDLRIMLGGGLLEGA